MFAHGFFKRFSSAVVSAVVVSAAGPALAAPAVDHDGPFGITIGEPIDQLGPTRQTAPGIYAVLAPAKSSNLFTSVTVVAFADIGVCRIVGFAPKIDIDVDGKEVKAAVDYLAATLKQKYGDVPLVNLCRGDESSCSDFWPQSANRNEADYYYQWDFANSHRPDGIGAIRLKAAADSSVTTQPVLYYFSANDDACLKELKAAQGASL